MFVASLVMFFASLVMFFASGLAPPELADPAFQLFDAMAVSFGHGLVVFVFVQRG
jgi:hypothetical protein